MELNWSTFILEIINFLILVWLLARFLYRPVMNVINERRREIQQKLEQAEAVHNDAEALKRNYENRLLEWEGEKSAALKQLHEEVANERRRLLEELQHDLEQEREKAGILNRRQMQEEKRIMEKQALQQGAAFTGKLLTRLANPALEMRLIDVVIEDLDTLDAAKQNLLIESFGKKGKGITITSAFPLTGENRKKIEQKLKAVIGKSISCTCKQDPELIAGLRIRIGAWLLQANLRDELKYFADLENDSD